MAAAGKQWYVGEDGCISVGEPANSVTYHSGLNSIVVTTKEPTVKIYDVTSGSVLQKSNLSVSKDDEIRSVYLPEKDKMVFCDSRSIGIRKDMRGVLLLDTALQSPLAKQEDLVKIELPLTEATQLLKSLHAAELSGVEYSEEVVRELEKQIDMAQEATKGNHKTTKWATVCLELQHCALKNVCSNLATEMRRLNQHTAGLSIASSVSDRLSYLLPSNLPEITTGPVDRSLMYSEAARRETFTNWPHMNYKWALPDPMAQAGFYHQPSASGDDRAMCFTCNVCLVCWEPTDEPWSEHERHSPSCPFVKGEHTQNVPLSVSYATQPAQTHGEPGEKIHCISSTCSEDYIATSTRNGNIVVWDLSHLIKKHCQFTLDPSESIVALKTGIEVDKTVGQQENLVDSLEETTSKGAEGIHEELSSADAVDAVSGIVEELVLNSMGGTSMSDTEGGADLHYADGQDELVHEIPLHEGGMVPDMTSSWTRPCEDIVVTSLCVLEKPGPQPVTDQTPLPSANSKQRVMRKKQRKIIQPSVICGVSLRRTTFFSNIEDEGGGTDIRTEVQLMNKVNEVVSGDMPPQIISDSQGSVVEESSSGVTEDELLGATSFVPYLLVAAAKEDVKKIATKQPSVDSLKPSTSMNNIVPTPGSMSVHQDWALLDNLYDSDPDPDIQIVKVTPAPGTLVAHSPTQGSKSVGQETDKNKNKSEGVESAIKKSSAVMKAGTILQCVELPQVLQSENLEVRSICPTLDREHVIVVLAPKIQETVKSSKSVISNSLSQSPCENGEQNSHDTAENTEAEPDSQSEASGGSILLYRIRYDIENHYGYVDENVVAVKHINSLHDGIRTIYILPQDMSDRAEEEEHIELDGNLKKTNGSVLNAKVCDSYGQMAVIFSSGRLVVYNIHDLTEVAEIPAPDGDKFVGVTYCSGMDRLCICSELGKLYFFQLSEDAPDQCEMMSEAGITPVTESPPPSLVNGYCVPEDSVDGAPRPHTSSELLAKQSLSFENLCAMHHLTQFENLMPRFTATVPPCWSEIQQEQQQRRHPQHLQHQGEATQHTRTWKLQTDGATWDEHMFEIVLPRVCCVGHVDIKFNLHPLCTSAPKIQITLLKQNINTIGRQSNCSEGVVTESASSESKSSIPVDSKINFNMKNSYNSDESSDSSSSSSSKTATCTNNVLDPLFLESHNAEILCGPVDLATCLDLSGSSGLVSLTSPQLLLSKPRSFLLHIKGFPHKNEVIVGDKPKVKTSRKRTSSPLSHSHEKFKAKTIKMLFENYSPATMGKSKADTNMKGCDWIQEISVTIRKTKKTSLIKERMQRNAMIELTSFQDKLMSVIGLDEGAMFHGVSHDYCQNMALDILMWIAYIQMHDPDKRSGSKCLLTVMQQRLDQLVYACFIQGTRTTAHKAARLLALCMEYCKSSVDPDLAPTFSLQLLHSLLECLPHLPSAYSAGAVKWYFMLLNRVKCMDIANVSEKCSELLQTVAKQYHERVSPLQALLEARYGLYGHPFEPDLFDMDLPQAVKQVLPAGQPVSYASVTATSSANTQTTTATQQEEIDYYDLFNVPSEKSAKTQIEYARNNILGMLEVEPLHFSCHSTSDGTKMERLDPNSDNAPVPVPTGFSNSGISGTINFGEALPPPPPPIPQSTLPYSLSSAMATALKQQLQELSAKNYPTVKHKIMHIKQILSEVESKIPQAKVSSSELLPPTPKTTPQVMTPPLTPPNEVFQQMQIQTDKPEVVKPAQPLTQTSLLLQQQQRTAMSLPQTQALLQPPPPQVLVIERMHAGARRFVILDFGKPVLLTDVIVPACSDLASLSIDVWVHGEEVDGQRLVVASDIGVRTLVMNNIMPPPVCRFLKMTTIGRYSSGTTRSKIPIGAFYGHSYIAPWEWSGTGDHHASPSTSSVANQLDVPSQSQLLTHLGSFMSLLEDIQCRYSLARTRLEALLGTVESLQYASFHTQYYLRKTKKNDEDNSILQAYQDCLQLQLQQNLAQRAINRLQSAIGLRTPMPQDSSSLAIRLKQASTDKLRFMMESLLETLITMTHSSPSIPQAPVSLYLSLAPQACDAIFRHLCVHGTRRIQILTSMLLVRVCGSQPWFGEFLGSILQEYYHSEYPHIFSQDRVFILLTAIGQKSIQGPSAVSIMESLMGMLARVLSPLNGGGHMGIGTIDLSLVGWILLFLCRNLDSAFSNGGNGDESEKGATAAASKKDGSTVLNRWNFIQGENNIGVKPNKSRTVKQYRRSLQKRLMHHKQKLIDLEQVKKTFFGQEDKVAQNASNVLLKQQEKQFRKELSQYASKHLKDIIQIRKNDAEMLRKMPKDANNSDVGKESIEYEQDSILVLPKEKCLPVVRGLMALLLAMDFTCNVDLFLVTCKVLARVCLATRPAITLSEAMSQDQLVKLILLAANLEFNHGNITWGGPWAGHALTCLLQDILEGERLYPGSSQFDGITDDDITGQVTETEDSLQRSASLPTFDESETSIETGDSTDAMASQSKDDHTKMSFDKESSMMVDMLLDESEYDDDTSDKLHAYVTGESMPMPPPPVTNQGLFPPPPEQIMPLSELDEDKYKTMKDMKSIKAHAIYGLTSHYSQNKPPTGVLTQQQPQSNIGQGLSTALDARLECGLEMQSELRLKVMLSLQTETLQGAFAAQLPVAPRSVTAHSARVQLSATDDELSETQSSFVQTSSTDMLSQAYDEMLSQVQMQRVNLDSLLQLWLTLTEETNGEETSTHTFDPSRMPSIPLSLNSVNNILASVAGAAGLPVRTWVLVFQSLTLLANLKIPSDGEAGVERSMVVAMLADSNLITIITKFLSVNNGPVVSAGQHTQVGPSATKAFYEFLQRLHVKCAEDNVQNLKELMLKLIYTLTAERGAFQCCLGPLDAQCKFLDFILDMSYEQVDFSNALSVIESISVLVNQHIKSQDRVLCKSTSDNGINARSCFGGLFASLLRGGDAGSGVGDSSRDLLMCSLLKLVNALIQIHLNQNRYGRRVSGGVDGSSLEPHTPTDISLSDATKLSQALATSTPACTNCQSDEEKVHVGQTDEQKTENFVGGSSDRSHNGHSHSGSGLSGETHSVHLADIILGHRQIMCNFIQALSYCNSNTMAMILGSSGMPSNMQETFTGGDPLSVGDGIYQILVTLSRKCSDTKLLLESIFLYLSGSYSYPGSSVLCRLSEPLLWFILKVLDTPRMLSLFLNMGGVEVVCNNLVNCNSRIISTSPSLISTIMQNMNGRSREGDRRKVWDSESVEGLQNFAPLGTITSGSPTASPAEVLINNSLQHRRARSAAWSYHFYPDEAWVDLTISLPFAILLKEVQIRPHSPALSTAPSNVSLEVSHDGITSFPLCAPMTTGSLVFIKLQLQRPEVVSTVTIRLHKARDSRTIGLTQILLMGYSAFGDVGYKTNNLFLPTEDFVSRSSVGWIRLLHHCLTSQSEMEEQVAEAAAPTSKLMNTCTALLVSPISGVYAPNIEAVLLKLGLHSGQMGLSLIDNLLRVPNSNSASGYGSQYLGKVSGVANDSTVEILYQLGTVQDSWTSDRVKAMLQWLKDTASVCLQKAGNTTEHFHRGHHHHVSHLTIPDPAPAHVHCIAAVLWQSMELPVQYNLRKLVNGELVSCLYEWSSVLNSESFLKKSVDFVLCSVCHICPEYFSQIMEWMGIRSSVEEGLMAPIPDDRKDLSQSVLLTDDSKEASSALGQSLTSNDHMINHLPDFPPITLQEFKDMNMGTSQLCTLAVASKSPIAIKQLLESGFPAVLAQGLFEFCNKVISRFAESWSQPEGISDSSKSVNGATSVGFSSGQQNAEINHAGLSLTANMVSSVLQFFSELSSECAMKDWLGGADGSIFWPVLLTMLCNTPLQSTLLTNSPPNKTELISLEERACIETATVRFFTQVISCHVVNQMLFAKVLCDVIKEQGNASKAGVGVCPLSGFTRRLFLQVLLEDEKILVAFKAAPQQYRIQIPQSAQRLQHPSFGAGRRFRTSTVNLHISVGELINKVSDTPSLAAQLLECQNDKKSDESKKDSSNVGMELVEYISKANSDVFSMESSESKAEKVQQTSKANAALPPRPPTRRGRSTADSLARQLQIPILSLYHSRIKNKSLPSDLSLSQLLQTLLQHGMPQGQSALNFTLQLETKTKESTVDTDASADQETITDDVLLSSQSFPTALQVFASVGGLALLAEHLPLLYPEISRQITTTDSSGESSTTVDSSQDWVTVESYPEEFYEMHEPMSPAPTSGRGGHPGAGMPTIPAHSLVAFGMFLRLPGYAEVLLKERKKAQCLLRLVLGVTDDGDGGHILTSAIASALPTLPFIVLKSLFDATPLTTDDGVLLRRMSLEIGAVNLILLCLSVLSHHAPRVSMPGCQQETQVILNMMQASNGSNGGSSASSTVAGTGAGTTGTGTTEEKTQQQQYWAKGTGFGTGSTTSSWDAEQALMRQKSEEEHVTCLLQVLASYVNPCGIVPEDFDSDSYTAPSEKSLLPDIVPELLSQSCLIPAMSSYLRNDSVLDMARHVPLYRALLELLRGVAVCPSLVHLLLPLEKDSSDSATSVGNLLEKMRDCVDTYASRLKSNKGKITGGTKEEEEENEGLALLIPDIQETARIVHQATERMKEEDDKYGKSRHHSHHEDSIANGSASFDEKYLAVIKAMQFDTYRMVADEGNTMRFCVKHHYENNVKAAGDIKNPSRIRRLAQEAVTLSTSLPLSVSSSVFVRCDEERLDIMKVLITGPADTPYANGCFEFDVYFPQDYPNAPPYINLETTGNHTVRFNPNLYNDGKVCLSVLNTWHGRPEEKWSAQTSSFLQVLVSIQSLILVNEPYFNEPGYERSRGTPSGTASSREYDANIRQATIKWAVLEQIKNPLPCFKEVIQKHFWMKRHQILRQCEEWITEMETFSNDKRTGRTIAHSTLALKRHYNQLREEFAKMKAPVGLEEEEGDQKIDPKEKHYSTEQAGAAAGPAPSDMVGPMSEVFLADPNANSFTVEDLQPGGVLDLDSVQHLGV